MDTTTARMTISTGFLSGDLLGDGIDGTTEQCQDYRASLVEAIRREYPDAEIDVDYQAASGVTPRSLRTSVTIEGDYESVTLDELHDRVEEIRGEVWEVWVRGQEAVEVHCQCGTYLGQPCEWHGPVAETVTVEVMPDHLRGSHRAAGNWGTYPANGAVRLRVHGDCADWLVRGGETTSTETLRDMDEADEYNHVVE